MALKLYKITYDKIETQKILTNANQLYIFIVLHHLLHQM